MMRVEIIAARDLDDGLEATWRRLQADDNDLRSPFFSPEFFRVVAGVRPDARIAVMHDGGEVGGFFAFHRQRFGRLAPLAGQISDYHGIVGAPARGATIADILRAASAQAYDFNHTPASQPAFAAHAFRRTTSPLVDLSGGYDAWRAARRAETGTINEVERKMRKLGRDIGPLRFVANDTSGEVWQALLDWKRASLAAIGTGFILDKPWAREVIETIRDSDTPDFGGMTSALWAGDELAAVHFGMRTGTTWHWWFPTYNIHLKRYSPGLALILESLRHAELRGIDELDFGRGDQGYKRWFANGERALCEGSVERSLSPLGATRRLRKALQKPLALAGPEAMAEFTRRVGDRLLVAGRIS
jgi:CelD/BcsL family acetyltransferase involved in cellulose biosynthesis